jgi:hypothetical protein
VPGNFLACVATNKAAERDTLVVAVDFEQRDALIAADPDVYYLRTTTSSTRWSSSGCGASTATRSAPSCASHGRASPRSRHDARARAAEARKRPPRAP